MAVTETGGREVSAQEELEKLEQEMLGDAARIERRELTAHDVSAWLLPEYTAKLAAIREGLDKAQGEAPPDGYLHDDGYYTFAEQCRVKMEGKLLHAGSRKIPFFLAPPADSAPSLEGISVSLCAPTASEPFRRLECSVVDIGHSDRVLVVECKELEKERAYSTQASMDALLLAGNGLSNAAHNLSQFDVIAADYRAQLRNSVKKWDDAIAAHKSEVKG